MVSSHYLPQQSLFLIQDFGQVRTLNSRCDFSQNLLKRGCNAPFIENPRSGISLLRSKPLSSKGSGVTQYDVIQIYPQKISLSLRPGDQTSFEVQVRPVEDYPVDLYYLMDLSLSMKDDLDTIRNLGTKLAEEMRKLTSNFRLGFGSFVDKNISPFSYTAPKYQDNPCNGYKLFPNCVPTFGFRHLLSLTDKVDRFNEEVQKQMVSRNRDAPEGGFDAILQAAVCKEKIGWRKEAYHLLVFATDDVPHLALDGRLGGLVYPHDGQCHLNDKNEYSADYPSLALLGEKLAENNIFLIFAVTKRHYVLYKNLTALIPGTTVEILDQDSKNIIQLIVNAYNNIRSKVELSVWDHPEDLNLAFTATCQDGQPLTGLRKCADLKIGDTVSFNVTVDARGCPPKGTSKSFTIRPVGFKDHLEVSVDYRCDCSCTDFTQTNSSRCNSAGTYSCGMCGCEPGHLGARCECEEGEVNHQYLSACREAEGKQVCSGRGECSCNQCLCYESEFGKIYGTFCECDDFSCARHKGILCSGHGECHCGECKCHAGYIGDNCNCSTETTSCVSDDGKICSGRGSCVCGRCQCTEPGAFGDTCEKCPTCPDACGTKRYETEDAETNLTKANSQVFPIFNLKEEMIRIKDIFVLSLLIQTLFQLEKYIIHYGHAFMYFFVFTECAVAPDAKTVLLAVVGSILLMGIVLLALWKLVITIHDRREFARFQSARSRARYEMASNPVYKQSIPSHPMEMDFHMHNIKSCNGGVH
uniref:Integrin beta n=1 Tax=Cyprinus carpio TaxID=7962 RepID=A0A8C1QBX0_CYPCA